MARRTQTYAIRLAVEGGGQVKAELVSVGQSGEQSLKRIESAGERASGGLKGLGRQAEVLRTGTLNDSSKVWDLIPMLEFLIENTTDPNRISFLVTGVYKFRVGVRRSGSTDTITAADLSYRKDGVNV